MDYAYIYYIKVLSILPKLILASLLDLILIGNFLLLFNKGTMFEVQMNNTKTYFTWSYFYYERNGL